MRSKFDPRFRKPSSSVFGILLMLLHSLALSATYVITKSVNQVIHPVQTAFLYKLLILIFVLPYCCIGGIQKNLRTKRIGLHIARGAFSCVATVCFFVAIKEIPASNATAISYLQHILISLIGLIFFQEVFHRGKIAMIVCGCLGALLIVKPGFSEFNRYYFFIFLADIFWAMNSTIIKMLGTTERTKAQLFYVMLFSTVFAMPQGIYEWKEIDASLYLPLGLLALFYLVHYVAYFKAFKYAEMSTVMPFDYTRVLFVSLMAILFLNEPWPDQYTLAGYLLIISGGIYAIKVEASRKKQKDSVNTIGN